MGDTGANPFELDAYVTLRNVTGAMSAEDRRLPVHALVLLGDNFYPDGLRLDELERRVRANVSLPFCRFAEFAEGARAWSAACPVAPENRRPVPIHAVLGNHDHASAESPKLQREAVARYVPNWTMAPDGSAVHELGEGVSLVTFDSTPVYEGRPADSLAASLERSQGPWRVVAAHHPVAQERSDDPERRAEYAAYRERVEAAIGRSGVPVHLFLAGHEHNLQVHALDPGLQVIAGSGSLPRSIRGEDPARLAGFEGAGFARVDLAGAGDGERLVVSLHQLMATPTGVRPRSRVAARWSVDAQGAVREE